SGSSSPSSKRLRLSSPTYDEQCIISQQELDAFDLFEKEMSQASSSKSHRSPSPLAGYSRQRSTELRRTSSRSMSGFRSAAVLPEERSSIAPSDSAKLRTLEKPSQEAGFTSAAVFAHSGVDDVLAQHDGFDVSATPAKFAGFGFASALQIAADLPTSNLPSSSPDAAQEHDYSDWFKSMPIPAGSAGFQSARTIQDASLSDEPSPPGDPSEQFPLFKSGRDVLLSMPPSEEDALMINPPLSGSVLLGFTSGASLLSRSGKADADKGKAKGSHWTVPSAAALARARETMQQWHKDIDEDFTDTSADQENIAPLVSARPAPSFQTPLRPALRPVENSFTPAQPPESPSPAGAGLGFAKPLLSSGVSALRVKNLPFKSPLVRKPAQAAASTSGMPGYVSSPLNPSRASNFAPASGSKLPAAFVPPAATSARLPPPVMTPLRPISSTPVHPTGFSTPSKALGVTPRRLGGGSAAKPKFTTPFKEGMRPGEPGRTLLEQKLASEREETKRAALTSNSATQNINAHTAGGRVDKGKGKAKFFDLSASAYSLCTAIDTKFCDIAAPPAKRQTLAASNLAPQRYSRQELEGMGIASAQLSQIDLSTALYYAFHSVSSEGEVANLGYEAAFTRLQELGCSLATEAWVKNHWASILWKLAGMVSLEPWREVEPETRRWCWDEVIKQLLYRYERELLGGSRPALRLIAAHDAPPSCPMVLCISAIIQSPGKVDDDGVLVSAPPELEVTDGWYKLRATADAPLGRAVKKGLIRVGRKIEVAGARFVDRKEPCEILEAYDSLILQLHGNSTKLAPWHAKLGFVRRPAISTLDSLTPDGGLVNLMDLVVVKLYDIGFVEYTERDGRMVPQFPHDEKTETKLNDQWRTRREAEASRLHREYEQRVQLYLGYAERLERRAGAWSPSAEDSAPDGVDSWYSELEDNANVNRLLSRLTAAQAGWLARHVREQIGKERDAAHDDIEREIDVSHLIPSLEPSC
ncbi:hypothetical protein OBBRIDRAFT_737602, partial [Obba rivulosa]